MHKLPTIFLVDDDDFAAELTAEILAVDYLVQRYDNGQSALDELAMRSPDLILLDVSMPGLSGYEVCRALRGIPAMIDLPVIFLSGMISEEERMAGYEAGGDDYLTKPVAAEELRSKVHLAITRYAERQRLKSYLSSAFSSAMTAMTNAAELGAVLQFLRNSFKCADYISLCREILNAMTAYGLEASVQIRGRQSPVCYSAHGPCSPLEESVLSSMSRQGRVIEFGTRTSYSFDHMTLIIKNMPRDDAEHYQSLNENLMLLSEGVSARVTALDNGLAALQLAELRNAQQQGVQHQQRLSLDSSRLIDDFGRKLDSVVRELGIAPAQQQALSEPTRHLGEQLRALFTDNTADSTTTQRGTGNS
ncbi:MAG: response regulator [Pseudomonadota bacterium]